MGMGKTEPGKRRQFVTSFSVYGRQHRATTTSPNLPAGPINRCRLQDDVILWSWLCDHLSFGPFRVSGIELGRFIMVGLIRRYVNVLAFVFGTAMCPLSLYAQERSGSSAKSSQEPAPASSNLQREYARLAQLLNSSDSRGVDEAEDSLLKVRPSDVADPNTRK